ncbi:hypothetical protein [Streptomyces iranensis]|uniref:Uncharacterized protein n=1 Tax=Streptomyces iranensis TaxID=576784 RepID=A0A061A3F1_9ACTN|nr:hypothetical protein [Streptomyces iranensis]MBP2059559.1 hypothetical protein [Streptomyces iranensis]CDR10575.1 predicted protein [Streptomyces iranensis]
MPKKRFFKPSNRPVDASSSVLRRAVMIGIILAMLAGIAGLVGYLTRPGAPAPPPSSSRSASPAPHKTPSPGSERAVAKPPHTSDPVTFAEAATKALWTYDTRHGSRAEHLTGLKAWMTGERNYRDWESVTSQVPSEVLWLRMHDNHQRARAKVSEGHFPEAFKTAMSQDPGAITQTYVYAVTVTGEQSIGWKHGGSGAEPRSATLAIQCRPHHDCALSGVLPEVAP